MMVYKKEKENWFGRIMDYYERLLSGRREEQEEKIEAPG